MTQAQRILQQMREATYTTRQLLDLLVQHKGIQRHLGYISRVIQQSKNHPLKQAKIAHDTWDKKIVDDYLNKNPSE